MKEPAGTVQPKHDTPEAAVAPAPTTKRKLPPVLVALIAVGVLLAGCIVVCVGYQYYPLLAERIAASQYINKEAPDFTLTSLAGNQVTLSELRGQPVVINFWATWCPSCVGELPAVQTFYDAHGSELRLLAISTDSSESTVRDFVEQRGMDMTILLDAEGQVSSAYRVRAIPSTIFVDPQGIVVSRHVGALTVDGLESYLAELKQSEHMSLRSE